MLDCSLVIVAVALNDNERLRDVDAVALCDPLRDAVVERLAVALVLSIVLLVYEVVLLSLGEAVLVVDNVEDDVNVVLLELLGEKLVVLLVVALVLVVMLWLVDGDADIETVVEDVSDTLAVADTVPEWDALVVALRVDVIVGVLLSDRDLLLLVDWVALLAIVTDEDIDCDVVDVKEVVTLDDKVCGSLVDKVSEALMSADEEIVSILVVVSSNVNDRVIAAVDDLDCDTL